MLSEIEKEAIEARKNVKVGDGVTINMYTDRHACTVIKRTKRTITIQRDKVTHADGYKPEYIQGGFSVICTNNEKQKWDCTPDPEAAIHVCHWSDKRGCFRADGCLNISNGRHHFHDYNF